MDQCSVRGCPKEGGVTWPLMPGEPSLCSAHYDNPPAQYAGLVRASQEPPDDFDIPDEFGMVDLLAPPWLREERDIWITREGERIAFPNIEDSHLINIRRMLARIEADHKVGGDLSSDLATKFYMKVTAIQREVDRRSLKWQP